MDIPPHNRAAVIVVAEDDELLRITVVELLTDDGFEVLEAGHAEEALRILCHHAERVQDRRQHAGSHERAGVGAPRPSEVAMAPGDDRIRNPAKDAAARIRVFSQAIPPDRLA